MVTRYCGNVLYSLPDRLLQKKERVCFV
uniref:Uncharacterized protein n=1 Tax=Arundo donax TaxID=35708 RepID=A0A0A8Y2V9_ARUDO